MLGEGIEPDKIDQNIEVTGLDLTESEDRTLSAIQKLLSKTDYKGNRPGKEIYSENYKWKGTLPVISMTYFEYTVTESKPLYLITDAIKFLSSFQDNYLDVLLTDPPYSIDIANIAETPKLCPLADDAGPFYPDS